MDTLAKADVSICSSDSRFIGSVEGGEEGPTIIALAGVHGNETPGIEAVLNVMEDIKEVQPDFRGELIGLRGNLGALEKGVRFIDEDMNRLWFPSILKKVARTPEEELDSHERKEVKRLREIINEIIASVTKPIIIADLHTFSAEGYMFMITSPVEQQIEMLSNLYAPMVFGIEETLRGTTLSYYETKGVIPFVLEGGQHENELTSYNMTAALMLLLCSVGSVDSEEIPVIEEYQEHLKAHTRNLPSKVDLVYQHIIEPGDQFNMRPGYQNFQPIKKGEWLANDKDGKINAQTDGFILMPLYQKQGDDGFFIIKERG